VDGTRGRRDRRRHRECTIITTRPNELVAPVHDRMPVILPTAAEAVWLDPSIGVVFGLQQQEPC
jgi:putative SOS response-associated peptidase YedK